jgi:hypothetical protein
MEITGPAVVIPPVAQALFSPSSGGEPIDEMHRRDGTA